MIIQVVRGLANYALPDFLRLSPTPLTALGQEPPPQPPPPSPPPSPSPGRDAGRTAGRDQSALALRHCELSPRATRDLVARLDLTPTLLPQNLASLITAASLAARVSLRSSAFLIELVFEASRYGTLAGLGITRRALITAVSSARAVQAATGWVGEDGSGRPDAVLDRYTNIGIYVIHHGFTMAELFAIAGLNLTQAAVSSGFEAAEESVRMFDSVFGSNESSRALSAIIVLVRKELLQDPRFSGSLTSLVALTKALTAFACLQVATRRRTMVGMKMRVVWDATVIAESETVGSPRCGPGGRAAEDGPRDLPGVRHGSAPEPSPAAALPHPDGGGSSSCPPSLGPSRGKRLSIMQLSEADREGLVTDVRSAYEAGRTWHDDQSMCGSGSWRGGPLLSRAMAGSTAQTPGCAAPAEDKLAEEEEEAEIQSELGQLLGENIGLAGAGAEELPEEIKQAMLHVAKGHPGSNAMEVYNSEKADDDTDAEGVRLVEVNGTETVWEVTAITTETTTTTTLETSKPVHLSLAGPQQPSPVMSPSAGPLPECPPNSQRKRTAPGRRNLKAVASPREQGGSREDEWVEIGARRYQCEDADAMDLDPRDQTLSTYIPSVPNGRPSVGALARVSTIDSPEEGRQKLQVVLKTMTKKLSQRKDTVRRLRPSRSAARVVEWPTPPWSSDDGPTPRPRKPLLKSLGGKAKRAIPRASTSETQPGAHQSGPAISPTSEPSSPSMAHNRSEHISAEDPVWDSPVEEIAAVSQAAAGTLPLSTAEAWETDASPSVPQGTKRPSATSHRTTRTRVESTATTSGPGPPHSVYPREPLVKSLSKFMRYSSAAYGQQFLRIMGIGRDRFDYPDTQGGHANHHAFASHVGVPVEQIILSSFTEPGSLANDQLSPLVHYIAVDHEAEAVVLTARGTLGLSDVLVDLTCEYEAIEVDGGDVDASYLAHSGMLHSALRLRRESSTVHEILKQTLIDHPDYGLVLTGHSLGGGVAALMSVLFATRAETFLGENQSRDSGPLRHPAISTPFVTSFKSGLPPGRPIHCYAFGSPAVASLDLCRYTQGLVTTVCHGLDVVPTLSLGVVHDFKNVAVSLYEEENVAAEVVGRVIGLYQSRRRAQQAQTGWFAHRGGSTEPDLGDPADGRTSGEMEVELDEAELAAGRGRNRAGVLGYSDPALQHPGLESQDDPAELSDWLWSLIKTMRANSDAEKLYPPGQVWHIESFEVFVQPSEPEGAPQPRGQPAQAPRKRLRTEGRRIILRRCDDVTARFSEPIFGRTMFNDHIPTKYELSLQLLEEAVAPCP